MLSGKSQHYQILLPALPHSPGKPVPLRTPAPPPPQWDREDQPHREALRDFMKPCKILRGKTLKSKDHAESGKSLLHFFASSAMQNHI